MKIRSIALVAAVLVAMVACPGSLALGEEMLEASKTAAQRRADQMTTKKTAFDKEFGSSKTNLYVRKTGSDSNDGSTPSKAFKTIQKAIGATKKSGTMIVVGPGSYNEELTFTKATQKGTSGNPNTIVGDFSGTLTGDKAEAVTILGTGKNYGLNMSECEYWQFKYLTFTGQAQMSVYATLPSNYKGKPPEVTGLLLDGCTFNVPTGFGVYAYYISDFEMTDCDFLRSATSGHCTYLYASSGNTMTVTGNRFLMNSGLYAKSKFKSGSIASINGNASYCYGLIAMVGGSTACTLTVQNNIVSDAYIGIYAYAYGGKHTTVVANNTATNCLYATYAYTYSTKSCTVSNNINCDSYIGLYMYSPEGKLLGEIESGITIAGGSRETHKSESKKGDSHKGDSHSGSSNSAIISSYIHAASVVGLSTSQAPVFNDPGTGDFSLKSGSIGIDTGYANVVPLTDVYATARPLGSTASGLTGYDYGAIEAEIQTLLKVVRWKETSQDE
ncbi:MAG: right-handed parallel beta-helix repeat-containing protein [Planctomycetota bacterium]